MQRALRHERVVRAQIVLEVHEASARYQQAEGYLAVLRTQVLSALQESVARAEKAYANGNMSYLLVLETSRRLMDARRNEAESVAALRRARAELERSVGHRLK